MKPAKTKETRCGTCGAEYLVDIGIPHRMGCPDVDNPEAAMPAERMDDAEFERLCLEIVGNYQPVRVHEFIAEARRARESEAGKFWDTLNGKVIAEQEAENAALHN